MYKKLFFLSMILVILFSISCEKGMTKDQDDIKAVEKLYYDSLMSGDYSTAYKLLDDSGQKYYGSAGNFASTFTVPGLKITEYKIYKVSVDPKTSTAKVKVVISFEMPSFITSKSIENTKTDADFFLKQNGKWKIRAKFGPYRSVKISKSSEAHGLKMDVYFIDLYDKGISVHVAFFNTLSIVYDKNNTGKDNIMIFPYNINTFITDDKKVNYSTSEIPNVVDPNLYRGFTLKPGDKTLNKPGDKVLGFINFTGAPKRDNKKFTLKVGNNLNPTQKAKFDLIIKDMQINN